MGSILSILMDSHDIKECIYLTTCILIFEEVMKLLLTYRGFLFIMYMYKPKTYNCRTVSPLLLALVNFSTSLIPAQLLYTMN